ncbi:MAG: hypothetical protein ACRD0K_22640 [Egibacteraceae bacterium]
MSRQQPVVMLEDVLTDLSGLTDVRPLVNAVNRADVDAGVLTDEEVHWIGPNPDGAPRKFIDAPRLAQLSAREQQVAMETALWIMQARGEVFYDADADALRFEGLHALLGDLRENPEAAVSVRVDVRDEGVQRAAIYRIRPDLFLCEDVSEVGLHHFTFRSAARQAAWLAAAADPNGHASHTGSPQSAADVNGLDPHPDRLAATCQTAALVLCGSRSLHGRTPQRTFTAYSGPDGVHVLTGWKTATDGQVVMQQLSRQDLIDFCAAFLSPDTDVPAP